LPGMTDTVKAPDDLVVHEVHVCCAYAPP
jgi:hypothetical protein